MEKRYYVYELWFEGSTTPFYVGKTYVGSGRLSGHIRSSRSESSKGYLSLKSKAIRREHLVKGVPISEKIVFESNSEIENMEYEHCLIRRYGRLDLGTGFLTNQTFGWEGTGGRLMTPEIRSKLISEGVMLRPPSDRKVEVSLFLEDGSYVETLESVTEACNKYGFYTANISKTIRGDSGRKTVTGNNGIRYQVRYGSSNSNISPVTRSRHTNVRKVVSECVRSGTRIIHDSVVDAARFASTGRTYISRAISGKFVAKGYHWRYLDSEPPQETKKPSSVVKLTLDGVEIGRFESISAAAESVNTVKSAIGNCVSGRTKSSMGFLWRYVVE